MTAQIITGNRLGDGAVVFLARNGAWDPDIENAKIADNDRDAELLAQLGGLAEQAQFVVGPYTIDIADDSGRVEPVKHRERIRAFGPSTEIPNRSYDPRGSWAFDGA